MIFYEELKQKIARILKIIYKKKLENGIQKI
ncbi:hypothetical protein cco112_00340 [Campylobacter coli 2685]|uniref:Uncharacterized protein n=1 Tax=Campylobacter coli 80352 TaxID=887288 RepID=A0ABP2NTK3_CAMCO|nr:hypothetical protein CCO0751 [Campylobacter coli RM2228]EIA46989.1 hypothetical protein cco111_06786 [Campylobacter coli 2680]EIA50053.1 hypothetical protein cco105_00875 [Campylobacter coli 2548]EIA53519.1 hypothetical protein cco112_00340 [Campylobacter coli 2685]EIA54169.1 hypothetical protein cco113_07487 [Campylobacter coli 2688]EIA56035.1 hypothetical protein cco117_06634 [Campylobacter coli 2698]EIA65782.1 hypothetical protein cco14_02190 [Campylobacter coli 80352]EIA80228.1 hypoth